MARSRNLVPRTQPTTAYRMPRDQTSLARQGTSLEYSQNRFEIDSSKTRLRLARQLSNMRAMGKFNRVPKARDN